jgi:hypothetical protein
MRWRLTGRNIRSETLVSIVENFFADRGFRERRVSSGNRKKQMDFEARREGKLRSVRVTVCDIRDGFEIEFAYGESAEALVRISALTTPFAGGLFLRDNLKYANPRFFERLEADFWDFVDIRIRNEGRDTKA